MKNSISKYMMIAAAAVAMFAATGVKAAPGGGGTTTTTPTAVEEQAVPAKTAVKIYFGCNMNANACSTSYQVPIGYRLVIESMNAAIYSTDPTPIWLYLVTGLNGINNADVFTPTQFFQSGVKFVNGFIVNTKIYADQMVVLQMPSLHDSFNLSMNGYLVKK